MADQTDLILNLTGLNLSELEPYGVFELNPDHKEHLLRLYQFEEVPDANELSAVVEVIVCIVADAFGFDLATDEVEGFAFREDCVALIGGVCPVYLLSSLEQAFACELGIRVVYPVVISVEAEPKTTPPTYVHSYAGAVEPYFHIRDENGEVVKYKHV
jgi:hypothetical protein